MRQLDKTQVVNEDTLPEDLTDEEYNLWFESSWVDGVRLGYGIKEGTMTAGFDYDLFERLAEIEHERWADWQKYVHSKITPSADDGICLIGEEFVKRWEKQIKTPYSELTEQEKESDRQQVRRYWDLIQRRGEK